MRDRRVSAARQRFAASYVLPDDLPDKARRRLGLTDVGFALRGLRQWLRLRILTDKPMGMPSLAVQVVLDELLADRDAAEAFRHKALGHHADHLISGVAPNESAGQTMALSWAMACSDEQLRASGPERLPTLFAVDAAIAFESGWVWTAYCGHEPCTTPDHCVHHDLLPHLPNELPHQIHFDQLRPYSLQDKSDDLWIPGYNNIG